MLAVETYWQLAFPAARRCGLRVDARPPQLRGHDRRGAGEQRRHALGRFAFAGAWPPRTPHAVRVLCTRLPRFACCFSPSRRTFGLFSAVYLLYTCASPREASSSKRCCTTPCPPKSAPEWRPCSRSLCAAGALSRRPRAAGWSQCSASPGVWPLYAAASLALELVAFASDAPRSSDGVMCRRTCRLPVKIDHSPPAFFRTHTRPRQNDHESHSKACNW